MTTNFQLNEHFKDESKFLRCFSRNELPLKLDDNEYLILNLNKTDEPGSHWCACYRKNGILYYFDSFGITPPPEVLNMNKDPKTKLLYNVNQIQDINSSYCGHYCVHFIEQALKDRHFIDTVYNFGSNTLRNDNFIKNKIKL